MAAAKEDEPAMFYAVEYDATGPTVIAHLPDLPGTHDEGATREEALERLRGAAIVMLQSLIDDREDIPDPSPPNGRPVLSLPSVVWAKVLLYRSMQEKGWRKADMARAIAKGGQKAADRLLNLSHASKPDQIDAAFAALGLGLVPEVQRAA